MRTWLPFSEQLFYALLALAVWTWLQPPLEETKTLEPGWVASVWVRNVVLMTLFTAGLHLWLYRWRKQGLTYKFDRNGLSKNNRKFAFGSQLWDNVAWSLLSGVTVWTIYEVGIWWAYSNGVAPVLTFADNPVWFIALFPLLLFFQSMHFYWVHRFLHWPPLYQLAHAVHHRNVSYAPWSGFSMHPVEHVLYLSGLLIHLVLPTSPAHMLFYGYWLVLATATSHSGYESLVIGERAKITVGTFFHQLHHRHFNCNYGSTDMPWDRWFGSYHDGTTAATKHIRAQAKERLKRKNGTADSSKRD